MDILATNVGLRTSTRLRPLSAADDGTTLAEVVMLVAIGALAAVVTTVVDFNLRMPGNAILKAVLPLSFGLACVPRRFGGAVMGASAALTATGMIPFTADPIGVGSMTSLCLSGPLLDLALWRARPGTSLYLRFALAGLAANLAALVARGVAKWLASGGSGGRPFQEWVTIAPWTYALCGLAAGLISAAVWFRWNPNQVDASPRDSDA